MIKCDHWVQVEMGLDEIPLLRINFNGLKRKKQKTNKHLK